MSMTQAHRNLLRGNRVFLVKELTIDDDFLAPFIAEDIFSTSNCEVILSKPTGSARAATFLDLVVRRGEDAWPVIFEAIAATKQFVIGKHLDPVLTAKFKAELGSKGSSNQVQPMQETEPAMEAASQRDESPIMKELIDNMPAVSQSDSNLIRIKTEEVYDLRRKPRGRVLIINNSTFKPPLTPRAGAQFDGTNLCELFNSLYFETDLKENLTAREMKNLLVQEAVRSEHEAADAFILCILSHGANGVIYGSDGRTVDIERQIIQAFNGKVSPSLVGKPKAIIIQACQGETDTEGIQQDGPSTTQEEEQELIAAMKNLAVGDTHDSVPDLKPTHELADMLIAYATCPGYKSFRQTELGSWFVREFIKQTCLHAHQEHLEDILTRVRRAVLEKKTNVLWFEKAHYIQLTETRNRLLKPLFFFPGYAESHC